MRFWTNMKVAAAVTTALLLVSGATGASTDSKPADTGSISGVVVDANNKPVAGAGVEISEKVLLDGGGFKWNKLGEAKSEKDGSFKIVDLPAGKNIRLGAWLQMPNGPMVQGGKDLKVEAGKNTDVGKIKLQSARM
ncbi:MAG: carboxypeptidase regulatory-like domain-containing protein [Planctomycetes bacterium]|nr:carboxypeptidase regulatory-like domain-containing protein [Planctomycetota bacterium]